MQWTPSFLHSCECKEEAFIRAFTLILGVPVVYHPSTQSTYKTSTQKEMLQNSQSILITGLINLTGLLKASLMHSFSFGGDDIP